MVDRTDIHPHTGAEVTLDEYIDTIFEGVDIMRSSVHMKTIREPYHEGLIAFGDFE